MISTTAITLYYGSRKLFSDVNTMFSPGNCYGVIGANGAGKSTFLKILSGEIEATSGEVHIGKGLTLSVLKQDHFQYQDCIVLDTVIAGSEKLSKIRTEKDALYANPDFSEEDGVRAAELEATFSELGGWEAESNAATLLAGLGIGEELIQKEMKDLKDSEKIKVLLAQALFGNPDVLLLDEPTNHLDARAIVWLENFLLEFNNTVIVVSHDRHFLNKVCTHMVDIDYSEVKIYAGNYDFWQQSAELAIRLRSNNLKKSEDKAKELETFIRRFSANASKSKQATSRRKQLDKLTLDDIPVSTRKRPHVIFNQEREAGNILLEVSGLSKTIDGVKVLDNISFNIATGEKVLFVSDNEASTEVFFQIIAGNMTADSGTYNWGTTTSQAYLPKDYNNFFEGQKKTLIEWLRQYSHDESESFLRGFLGKMLFSGDETLKFANVLSGGEKVRCMLSRMMLQEANVLLLDGPTNHLDLESITSLNNGLIAFGGTVLFATHDQEFAESLAGRIVEIKNGRFNPNEITYRDYLDGLQG